MSRGGMHRRSQTPTAPARNDRSIVRALMRPEAYPHRPEQVEVAETHISYLFFTGEKVYKVKKPVDYGFLDFSTPQKRHFFCLREVELNRRLSPKVYLGVVPIREQRGCLKIDGSGRTVEHAVEMRQLPRERSLDRMLCRNQVSKADIQRLAARIATFHANAETSPEISRLGDLETVRQNIEENFEQTQPYINVCLSREDFDDLAAYSEAFLEVKRELFERRARQGRVRDGHGDLHAGNVFLDDDIHIIDCIEFNDRFRCLDVCEDIAFLAMDLDSYGRHDLSQAFVSAYVQMTGDPEVWDLLDFFKTYRAYVRAKIASFRRDEADLASERAKSEQMAQRYFRLAHSFVRRVCARPMLILVSGLMGSGKTRMSQELARRWDLAYISSDVTRKTLAGVGVMEHRYEDYGQGIYSPGFSQLTYETMCRDAEQELSSDRSVVLDAGFGRNQQRKLALEVARSISVRTFVVECIAADEEIQRRLDRRIRDVGKTPSDGRWELFQRQKADWEPIVEAPERNYIRLDTNGPRTDSVRTLLRACENAGFS